MFDLWWNNLSNKIVFYTLELIWLVLFPPCFNFLQVGFKINTLLLQKPIYYELSICMELLIIFSFVIALFIPSSDGVIFYQASRLFWVTYWLSSPRLQQYHLGVVTPLVRVTKGVPPPDWSRAPNCGGLLKFFTALCCF